MRRLNEKQHEQKKIELMEKCYACYAENGLGGVGIKALGEACGCPSSLLYFYFKDLDELIIQATEHCMSKVEDEFMAKAPTCVADVERFLDEIPYWTAQTHGKKYRLMYQVYTTPKYIEYGKKFFRGVDERYTAYAKALEGRIGLPYQLTTPLIFLLIRACVHYALFEDEFYLQAQMRILKKGIQRYLAEYSEKNGTAETKD